MFHTIFFDAAGTLMLPRRPIAELYLRHATRFGFVADRPDQIRSELKASFHRVFRHSSPLCFPGLTAEVRIEREREWWRRVVRLTFEGLGRFPRFDEYFAFLYDWFGSSRAWRLEASCLKTLHSLKKRGRQLGIISNFDSRLYGLLEQFEIAGSFDCVVISSEAPAAKPERPIFETALLRAGAKSECCVHVGDSYRMDYQGARLAGMASIVYDPQGRFPELPPTERIDHLGKLARLLL